METTSNWNWFITNIFSRIINSATETEVKDIKMTELNMFLSNEEQYKYNYIPGYKINEIPLGSAKQIECNFLPTDATDKSIEYYTTNPDIVKLDQSGNKVSVVGIKEGKATICSQNKSSGLISSCDVNVVRTVAPTSFEISVDSQTVLLGKQQTVRFDIDGGCLGHDELINFRYYDTRRLSYHSSDETIFTVDNYGVIYPHNVGSALLTISNGTVVSKTIDLTVIDGEAPVLYDSLLISGSNICYDNDMIKDQGSGKYHQQLRILDGENELNPDDFIWESSNELLAKVDRYGIVRGFRKRTAEDEKVIISATSKITGQIASLEMIVKEQLPESMSYWISYGKKDTWMPDSFTACKGDVFSVTASLNPNVSNKNIIVEDYDNNLISVSSQGRGFTAHVLEEGECTISFYSEANPSLRSLIQLTLLKTGAINEDNIVDVGLTLRKVLGHAFVFGVAQIFTCLCCYFFLYDKKIWIFPTLSFSISLTVAIISEIIERNIPSRSGTVLDVLIDMSGVIIALAIVFSVIFFAKRKKEKQPKSK